MNEQITVPLSFNKGLRFLNDFEKEEAKKKIMERIGITSDIGYNNRRLGKVKHDVISAKVIEGVFAEYKVKPSNVWGD